MAADPAKLNIGQAFATSQARTEYVRHLHSGAAFAYE